MPALSSFGGLAAIGRGSRADGRKLVQLTLTANTTAYVLNTSKVTDYEPGNTDVELTINAGVVISALSTGAIALDVDTSWNALDTVKLINNGTICGMGGAGGAGQNCAGTGQTNGASGGLALRAQRPIAVTNNGVVAGGGGGGGASTWIDYGVYTAAGCGGGGGQGSNSSAGGAGGSGCNYNCNTGGIGGVAGAGAGGTGNQCANGSNGGAFGSSGVSGSASSGGAAGSCTSGNANITWLTIGTLYGALN